VKVHAPRALAQLSDDVYPVPMSANGNELDALVNGIAIPAEQPLPFAVTLV
jgi:hypothetical protein